jgi:LysR family hydrogen peroxide-inducible transcriptional activator
MELHQLRYALAVHREKHFGRAAQSVPISQPTLSQQIHKLERELGVRLFERSPHGVRTTPAGERFMTTAAAGLETLDRAATETKEGADALTGTVRLGAIPTAAPYLLPDLLSTLKSNAPRVVLEFHELTTALLMDAVKAGRVDIGLLALPVGDPGFETRVLGEDPFYLAVAARHPLAGKKRLRLSDIASEPLLILQEGHCFRNQSLAFCKMAGRDPRVVFEGSGLESVMRVAATGAGVTFVPRLAVRASEHPGLRFIPFQPPAPSRTLGGLWRSTMIPTRAHRVILDRIARVLESPRGQPEKRSREDLGS